MRFTFVFLNTESRWVMREVEWRNYMDAWSGPILWPWPCLPAVGPWWTLFHGWKPCLPRLSHPYRFMNSTVVQPELPACQESCYCKDSIHTSLLASTFWNGKLNWSSWENWRSSRKFPFPDIHCFFIFTSLHIERRSLDFYSRVPLIKIAALLRISCLTSLKLISEIYFICKIGKIPMWMVFVKEKQLFTRVQKYSSPSLYFSIKLFWNVLTMILNIINYKKSTVS